MGEQSATAMVGQWAAQARDFQVPRPAHGSMTGP
jgi:hypothetical protein